MNKHRLESVVENFATLLLSLMVSSLLVVLICLIGSERHPYALKQGVVTGKHHDETWNVEIAGTNATGKHMTRTVQTEKSEYDRITIGQHLEINETH